MKLNALTICWLGSTLLPGLLPGQSFEPGQSTAVADSSVPAAPPAQAPAQDTNKDGTLDKRIYGVLPNYRMADGTKPFAPITAKQKLMIGFRDSFDYPVYGLSAIFAGLNQLRDTNPEFGEGAKGYLKRYGTSYADQVAGNMMAESFFPMMFHQDPRYFRVGKSGGSTAHRAGYALSRILVCHDDKGGYTFNMGEIAGNATAVAISNLYYTSTRNAGDNAIKFATQVGTDAISNLLKEFWPDVKAKFSKKKKD